MNMSSTIIGMSNGEMGELENDMANASIRIDAAKKSLKDAINEFSIKNSTKATNVKLNDLNSQLKNLDQIQNKTTKMISNINYIINRFCEVDSECAQQIKASGYDYRKSIGELTMGEKIGNNIVGNTVDGVESWFDRNKFTIEKVGTIVLEAVSIGVFILTLPETFTVWTCLGVAGAILSGDSIFTQTSALYERNVENESEEDSTGVDPYEGGFGMLGSGYGKIIGGDQKYTSECFKTGYDRFAGTIVVLNAVHAGTEFFTEDSNKMLEFTEDATEANKTLEEARNAEGLKANELLENQNKIDDINNLQQKVDYIQGLQGNVSRAEFGKYRKQLNYANRLLQKGNKSLPQLENNVETYKSELGDLQFNTLEAQSKYNEAILNLDTTYKSVAGDIYSTASAPILFNTENTQSSFHLEYLPSKFFSNQYTINPVYIGVTK
jgi:hypothetical protein